MNKRDPVLDNFKGFLILMVVTSHVIHDLAEGSVELTRIYDCICLFIMPGFVFVAGYFSKNVEKAREGAVAGFLVPYVLLDFALDFSEWIVDGLQKGFGEVTFFDSFRLTEPRWALWYLLCMFYWRYAAKDVLRLRYPLATVTLVALIIPAFPDFTTTLSLGRAVSLLFFFTLGLIFKKEWLEKVRNLGPIAGIFLLVLVFVLMVWTEEVGFFDRAALLARNPYGQTGAVRGLLKRVEFYVLGTGAVFSLFAMMPGKRCVLTEIGRNSLAAYILHVFFLYYFKKFGGLTLMPDSVVGILVIGFAFAFLMVFAFSREPAMKGYKKVMGLVNGIIFKTE